MDEASGNRTDLVESKVLTDVNTCGAATAKRGANGADFINANTERLETTVSLGKINWSMSAWIAVKDRTNSDYRYALTTGPNVVANNASLGSILVNAPDDDVYFIIGNAAGNYNDFSIANVFAANNTYYHIACTYNASTDAFYGYAQGGNKTTDTWVGAPGACATNDIIRVGWHPYTNAAATQYHDGWVDEVYMWNKVLTDGEVSDLYASGAGLFYRSAETFSETGTTAATAGISHDIDIIRDRSGSIAGTAGLSHTTQVLLNRYGTVAGTAGLSHTPQVRLNRYGTVAGVSGIDGTLDYYDNYKTRVTRETNRKMNLRPSHSVEHRRKWRDDQPYVNRNFRR
jgi:hypothetical protein